MKRLLLGISLCATCLFVQAQNYQLHQYVAPSNSRFQAPVGRFNPEIGNQTNATSDTLRGWFDWITAAERLGVTKKVFYYGDAFLYPDTSPVDIPTYTTKKEHPYLM